MKELLEKRTRWFEKKALEMGLDFFPINWEVVPEEVLLEVMSYGLPTRARHWSYGQSYQYQKIQGEMGMSKVYELVLNNDPSYAFLLDTNSDIANTMVIAHVIGHCFAGDTLVNTDNGAVEISSLEIGDKVQTHKGRYRAVTNIKETKKTRDIVELMVKGSNKIVRCTPEHRFLIKRDNLMMWVEAKDLSENDWIATPLDDLMAINRTWSFSHSDDNFIFSKLKMNRRIELVDEIGVWDIEVEEDHSFTLSEGFIAHNCHFFKHNYLFKQTDRKMVYHAAERAQRVEEYITQHGIEKVEHIMDIAFSLDKNIDWDRGIFRKPYPEKKKVLKKNKVGEFDDLYGISKPSFTEVTINETIPPFKEYDMLWFISNYADLEPWEKDVFEIIRQESFYFYPQYRTKIMNEGLASYVHAELMYLLGEDDLSSSEYIEFVKIHERVVQPGSDRLNINPYFLGFTILNDIKQRYDDKFKAGTSDLTGFQKILKVVEEEDDVSFLRRYLTQEIVDRLKMFTYVNKLDKTKGKYIQIESRNRKDVAESILSKIYHYNSPLMYIEKATINGLELVHDSTNVGTLDPKHIEKVCEYLFEIWNGMIDIKTVDEDGEEIHFTYDEAGFSHNFDI